MLGWKAGSATNPAFFFRTFLMPAFIPLSVIVSIQSYLRLRTCRCESLKTGIPFFGKRMQDDLVYSFQKINDPGF